MSAPDLVRRFLVQALELRIGMRPYNTLPQLADDLLAAGLCSDALIDLSLASRWDEDSGRIRHMLERALRDFDIHQSIPSSPRDAAMLLIQFALQDMLCDEGTPEDAVARVREIFGSLDDPPRTYSWEALDVGNLIRLFYAYEEMDAFNDVNERTNRDAAETGRLNDLVRAESRRWLRQNAR